MKMAGPPLVRPLVAASKRHPSLSSSHLKCITATKNLMLVLVSLLLLPASAASSTAAATTTTTASKKVFSYPLSPTMFLHPVHDIRRELLELQQQHLLHLVQGKEEEEEEDDDNNDIGMNKHLHDYLDHIHKRFESYTGTEQIHFDGIDSYTSSSSSSSAFSSSSASSNDLTITNYLDQTENNIVHDIVQLLSKYEKQVDHHDDMLQRFEIERRFSRLEHARVAAAAGDVDGDGDRSLSGKGKNNKPKDNKFNVHVPKVNMPKFVTHNNKDLPDYKKMKNNKKKNNKKKKNKNTDYYYYDSPIENATDYYDDDMKANSEFENMKFDKEADYMTPEDLQDMLDHDKEANSKHGGFFQDYQSTPLSQGPGTHYSTVWVGTPAQRVTVIADTGSHHTAFPCDKCPNCGDTHNDLYFDPERSITFSYETCDSCPRGSSCKNGKCEFGQSYKEGSSWRAYSSKDKFVIGPNHGTGVMANGDVVDYQADTWLPPSNLERFTIDFNFGCQFKVTGLFKDQLADGIMGMDKEENTIVKAMYREKVIDNQMFSMCFRKSLVLNQASVTAGVLTIGGVDERLQYGPMIYARSDYSSANWFRVKVKGVYLGRLNADDAKDLKTVTTDENNLNSGSGTIIDSGTTDTYLNKKFKDVFEKLWLENPSTFNQAYTTKTGMSYTEEQVANLPIIYIHIETNDPLADEMTFLQSEGLDEHMKKKMRDEYFKQGHAGFAISPNSPQDVLLAIPPEHYMDRTPLTDLYTPRLTFSESSGGVLGANAMRGHNVLFDMENNRVGIALSDCNYAEGNDINKNNVDEDDNESEDENYGNTPCLLGEKKIEHSCEEDKLVIALCSKQDPSKIVSQQNLFLFRHFFVETFNLYTVSIFFKYHCFLFLRVYGRYPCFCC